MKTEVIVTVFIQGFHYWKDADKSVDFLRFSHVHNFKIVAYVSVSDNDREVEFFEFAELLKKYIKGYFPKYTSEVVTAVDFGARSCEQIAQILVKEMQLAACEVWEDDLVGAKVYA